MGHRALVAYRRPDGRYDLRYSHWGGADLAVAERLSPEQPLGDGEVDPEPIARGVDLGRILGSHLDPQVHEALVVVSRRFEVTAYRVFDVGWGDDRDRGRGAIVEVTPGRTDLAVCTWFRATKTAVADAVEVEEFTPDRALSYLERRLRTDQRGTLYTYDADRGESSR